MKKVLSNFTYQSIMQIVKIIIPFLTVPIVSKALGANNIGLYRFSNSIVSYFMLFATLGITLYGQRQIAIQKNDNDDVSRVFWEIEIISVIATVISLSFFFVLCFFLDNKVLFTIQALSILSVAFDVSWFFMGIQDFKTISIRSLIVSIITLLLIVFFVNDSSDLLVYAFIQSSGLLISQISVWFFILKKIKFVKVTFIGIKKHISGIFSFFIPNLTITFYTSLNTTLLGIFSDTKDVAFYTNAIILSNIVITIISSLDTVLLPNLSNLFAKKDHKKIMNILGKSLNAQLLITIPAYFGICMISEKMIPWFFGTEFLFVGKLMPIISIIVIVIPLGMGISRQYLIPYGLMSVYNRGLIFGAAIGLIINLTLIPVIGIWGAVLSTVISELTVTTIRVKYFIANTEFKYRLKSIGKSILSSFLMYLVCLVLTKNLHASIVTTFIQVIAGIMIYLLLMLLFKEKAILDIVNLIKEKWRN